MGTSKTVFSIEFWKNFGKGMRDGIKDEMTYTNSEISECEVSIKLLENCLPPSDWYSKKAYDSAIKYMSKDDYRLALSTLRKDVADKSPHICYWVYKHVLIKVVQNCPKLLADALPMTYY